MKRLFNNPILSLSLPALFWLPSICVTGFLLAAALGDAQAQGRVDTPVNLLTLGTSAKQSNSLTDDTRIQDNQSASLPPVASANTSTYNAPFGLSDNSSETGSGAAASAQTLTEEGALAPKDDNPNNNSNQNAGNVDAVDQNTATPTLSLNRNSPRSDLPATSIGRRSVSKISLASVGLKRPATLSPDLNALIWSDSDAEQALYLLRNVPALGSAPILNKLVFEIMSIATVPPKGAGPVAEELVSARLNWLAAAGQSDALAEIVRMLPEDDRWANWKRWQVEYDLIRQADATACRDAEKKAQSTLDDFWHQSRIICALLAGDLNKARFAADILKASGGEDANFFQLVDKLLGRADDLSLDLTTLDSVDLVLMDAAREQISLAAFEQIPPSMIQAAPNFRYLAADAALKTSFMLFDRGLQEQASTEQIWRALLEAPMPTEAALATLDGLNAAGYTDAQHDALASASLWVSLALRNEADTSQLIQRAFQIELRSGRPELLADLYASLIRQRFTDTENINAELQKDFALLLALSGTEEPLPAALTSQADFTASLQAILAAANGAAWQAQSLDDANAWALLPILRAQQSAEPQEDWSVILAEGSGFPEKSNSLVYHRLSPPHLLALGELAEAGNIAETALLASMLVQPVTLGWIDPDDTAQIINALNKVGLPEVAGQFAEEVVKAHLLRRNFSPVS
jgi:hypothetical protein